MTNYTARYSGIHAFFQLNFAAFLGYTSVYLLDAGYKNTQIGIIVAVAGLISAILQPLLASYADRANSISLKKLILYAITIILVSALLLLFTYRRSMFVSGLMYGIGITMLQLLTPLINSLATETMNQGKTINFGVSRGVGSAAYAVGAYILGIVVNGSTPISIPISMIIATSALLFAVVLFPFQKTQHAVSVETTDAGHDGPLYFFKRYKRFTWVLIGCIFIYISHILLNTYTFQIVENIGGGSSEMGFSMALAAIVELPVMFLFTRIVKKVRCDILFKISGIFFFLKTYATYLTPNIPIFYAVQFLQMFGWALLAVSAVYYVNSIVDSKDAIKGQAYMTMTYTLGTVLGSLIGGSFIDQFGVKTMLLAASVAAGIGMIIFLLATERTSEE